jgi:hypothetical protein
MMTRLPFLSVVTVMRSMGICDKRTDVGLEATSTGAHDDETEDECCERTAVAVEYSWGCGGDEDDVADNGNTNGDDDGVLFVVSFVS